MKLLFLALLGIAVSCTSIFAHAWSIGGETLNFESGPGGEQLANCRNRHDRFDCDALRAFERARKATKKKKRRHSGDVNPAAIFCKSFGGRPMVGTDPQQNEEDFCRFPDGSLCTSTDLYRAAKKAKD